MFWHHPLPSLKLRQGGCSEPWGWGGSDLPLAWLPSFFPVYTSSTSWTFKSPSKPSLPVLGWTRSKWGERTLQSIVSLKPRADFASHLCQLGLDGWSQGSPGKKLPKSFLYHFSYQWVQCKMKSRDPWNQPSPLIFARIGHTFGKLSVFHKIGPWGETLSILLWSVNETVQRQKPW